MQGKELIAKISLFFAFWGLPIEHRVGEPMHFLFALCLLKSADLSLSQLFLFLINLVHTNPPTGQGLVLHFKAIRYRIAKVLSTKQTNGYFHGLSSEDSKSYSRYIPGQILGQINMFPACEIEVLI